MLPKPLLQDATRTMVKCLLQLGVRVRQSPMNPQAPCGGYRVGPMLYNQDENCLALPESEVQLMVTFSPVVPWNRGGVREAPQLSVIPIVGTHPVPPCPLPFFSRWNNQPSLPSQSHCSQLPTWGRSHPPLVLLRILTNHWIKPCHCFLKWKLCHFDLGIPKYSFHYRTISPVAVNSSSLQL